MMQPSYSKWDSTYDKQSDFQFEVGKKAIDSLNLRGNETVLDVGCGTGRTTVYCASKMTTGTVHGIDVTKDMVDFANQEYEDMQSVAFEHLSVLDLTYENKFDVVYSFFCLHWVREQEAAIRNIVRSLKSGGKALLYISCENELIHNWNIACNKVLARHPELQKSSLDYVFFQPADRWVEWGEKAGASVTEQRLLDRTKIFNSMQEFKEFTLALNIEPKMSQAQRESFLDQVISELYKIYGLSVSDPFEYTTTTLVLELRK